MGWIIHFVCILPTGCRKGNHLQMTVCVSCSHLVSRKGNGLRKSLPRRTRELSGTKMKEKLWVPNWFLLCYCFWVCGSSVSICRPPPLPYFPSPHSPTLAVTGTALIDPESIYNCTCIIYGTVYKVNISQSNMHAYKHAHSYFIMLFSQIHIPSTISCDTCV